jgi:hypothetical protein
LTDEYYGFYHAFSEQQAIDGLARLLGSDPSNFYAYVATEGMSHKDSFSDGEKLKPTQW